MYVNLNKDTTPLDGPSAPSKEKREKAMEMARPLTPKSERLRASYGSLEMSLQTVGGLCADSRKCVRRAGHDGEHYPT